MAKGVEPLESAFTVKVKSELGVFCQWDDLLYLKDEDVSKSDLYNTSVLHRETAVCSLLKIRQTSQKASAKMFREPIRSTYTHCWKHSCTQKESTDRNETWWVGLPLSVFEMAPYYTAHSVLQ